LIFTSFVAVVPLLVLAAIWLHYRPKKRWFLLPASCVIFGASLLAVAAVQRYQERIKRYADHVQHLRDLYPIESIDARLPLQRVRGRAKLSDLSRMNLSDFERSREFADPHDRAQMLQKLHEGTVAEFVRREGFGVGRTMSSWATSVLDNFDRGKTSVVQSSAKLLDSWQVDSTVQVPAAVSLPRIQDAHVRNVLHFVNPTGFGFIQDRQHVAGFQAHQFNALVEPQAWRVRRLELVGLVLAEEPRVYVTESLPRMDLIRGVPTRGLDLFEELGLEELERGEDIFIREATAGLRMLGAVRSAKQCLACHCGKRGVLLGAFSYFLERSASGN
jgi:hypothetical protein